AIESFRLDFRTRTVNLALDVLQRYEHMLYQERQKLQSGAGPAMAQAIASSGAAEQFKRYRSEEEAADAAERNINREGVPAARRAAEHDKAAGEAKAAGQAAVIKASGEDWLVQERGVNLEKLAKLDAAEIPGYLNELIDKRYEKL